MTRTVYKVIATVVLTIPVQGVEAHVRSGHIMHNGSLKIFLGKPALIFCILINKTVTQ